MKNLTDWNSILSAIKARIGNVIYCRVLASKNFPGNTGQIKDVGEIPTEKYIAFLQYERQRLLTLCRWWCLSALMNMVAAIFSTYQLVRTVINASL